MLARIQIARQVLTWKWINDQRTPLELVSSDLQGKSVVITGSNRGVGFEAAKHFAEMHVDKLILACRNVEAGNLAAKQISEATGCTSVVCWPLDLGSFASVCTFASRIRDENIRIDILVGNAAIMGSKLSTTEDGWEEMLQVNYLSNVLLTILLLPSLSCPAAHSNTGRPRIILLSSEAHALISRLAEADSPRILSKLNDREYCSKAVMEQRYFVSKLFVLFFSRELARLVNSDTGPIVVTVTPGLCNSDLDIESTTSPLMRHIKRASMSFIGRTPEMGSRTIVNAVTAIEGPIEHGKYLASCRVERESDFCLSREGTTVQTRLWEETMQILQKVDDRIEAILRDV
ncbi:NAD(P)-binding protein [Mycena venus]|uniref:NAD(P)-binding protein n=1 Tax=Mycena venus TaxID=2733690 RepID=A0A8H6Z1C0_9AGAR|nr:NAD(P)-binding protein [Mycena venus]